MTDQSKRQEEPKRPDPAEVYGVGGNEGQYDSVGKPDPRGPQAQKIHPDDQQKKKAVPPEGTDQQKKVSQPKSHLDVPLD